MKKKLLPLLLSLALCVSLLPAAGAEEEKWAYIFRDSETMLWGLSRFVEGAGLVTVLPAEYDGIWGFRDGTTIVHKNTEAGSTYGLVDYKGSFILPMEYDELSRGDSDNSDNILRAHKIGENFYRYLRPDGTPLTDYTFTECSDFCRDIGVGCRSIGGKELYGAINDQGEVLIPFEYDALDSPSPSYYGREWLTAEKDGCYGAFDYSGNLFRRCIYPSDTAVTLSLSLPAQMSEEEELNALIAASQTWEPYLYDGEAGNGLWGYKPTQYDTEYPPYGSIFWAVFASAQPFDETGHAQVTDENGRAGVIDQSGHFTPAEGNRENEAYLISITTADGVVTSGYRDEWRWVALSRADPGRPGILLRGEDANVTGSLQRSDGLPVGDDLDAWGKSQDGKPATLTLGKESWACTARYKDYGYQSVLYVEYLRDEETGHYSQPDSDTIRLFRYDWEQEAAGKYAAALEQLTQEEGYTVDEEMNTPNATIVLRHKEVPAVGGEAAYRDYELYLVARRAYYEEENIKRLLLPSTTLVGDYAPTHRAPDSLTVSEDGDTLTYVYSFDSPLSRPNGEVLHEAGTYTYAVDVGTGELTVSHSPAQAQTPPADPGADGFADVPAGSWFEKGVATCAGKGVMVGTGEGRFSPDSQLTTAECLTLAVRLYDLQRGGDGTLEKAPEEWGKYTLTLADGTVFTRWGEQTSSFHSGHFDPYNDGWGVFAVTVVAPGDTAEEQLAWAKAHEGPAVFTAEGKSYSGAVAVEPDGYDGPELRFGCEEEPHSGSLLSNCKPGPDRWYRDVVYTVERLGLREADGFSSLLGYLSYGSPDTATASRESFAKALAVAAGELEKKYGVTIPDVYRTEYTENIYRLYEAGILGGSDAFGTFQADKMLTRAECAVMVARVLDPAQRLTEPPATPETAYDQKLIDLRRGFGYYNERLFDTDICTVVVRDYGGMMHAQKGCITVVYKPGSAKGDGFTISPPHSGNDYSPLLSRNPDHMELSEDKKTFTYSYHFAQPFLSNGRIVRPAGDFIYTVDLATGEVTESIPQVDESVNTYAASLERFLADCAEKGFTVEQTVEAPLCSLIFCFSPIRENGDRSYLLYAVYKTDVDVDVGSDVWHTSQGEVKYFGLPTTRVDMASRPGAPMIYTHHMPDSMALSEDGNTFTLTYSDPYEGNSPTQIIDLRSGLCDWE